MGCNAMRPEYLPPRATLIERTPPPRSSVVAVLLGGLVVNGLGTIVAALVMTAVGSAGILHPLALGLGTIAIIESLAIAGGYVAARRARRHPIAHGVATGALALVILILLATMLRQPQPSEPGSSDGVVGLWLILLLTVQIPLAALGGRIAGRRAT